MIATSLALIATMSAPEGSPLSLADLPAYRSALDGRSGTVSAASFADLWGRPDAFRGRLVRVEGVLKRRFDRPAIAEFPALTEDWIVDASGNPIVVVSPTKEKGDRPRIGSEVGFEGTFLKILRYQGGDVERLAPLAVGPDGPRRRAEPVEKTAGSWRCTDLAVGGGAAALVVIVLLSQHLRRPARRPRSVGPPPEFAEEGDDGSAG